MKSSVGRSPCTTSGPSSSNISSNALASPRMNGMCRSPSARVKAEKARANRFAVGPANHNNRLTFSHAVSDCVRRGELESDLPLFLGGRLFPQHFQEVGDLFVDRLRRLDDPLALEERDRAHVAAGLAPTFARGGGHHQIHDDVHLPPDP